MYKKFQELSKEKQERIILAGMESFGKCGYKKALTDDIAKKAGISKGLAKKLHLIKKYPYMMNCILKAYLSRKEAVSDELNLRIQYLFDSVFDEYFQYIDFNKFKDHIDPKEIYHMMLWMAEGYLIDKQRFDQPFDVDVFLRDFRSWQDKFKEMCYKEEYL